MKRTILFSAILAALLAGCTMAEPEASVQSGNNGSLVEFVARTGDQTKVSVQMGEETPLLAWEEGDQIGIYDLAEDASRNYCYNVNLTENATECTLAPESVKEAYYGTEEEQNFYAYYPYDGEAQSKACEFPVVIPRAQIQAANDNIDHLRDINFMVAQTTVTDGGAAALVFESVFAYVQLSLTLEQDANVKVKQLRLKSTSAPLATEQGSIDLTSGSIVPITAESEVVVAFTENIVLNATDAQKGYLMVLPGKHAEGALSLEVVALDNSVATYPLPAVTFKSNGFYQHSQTVSVEDFVQSTPFDVAAESLTGKVGEPVNFTISGVADAIDLFTGEEGHDYELRNTDKYVFESLTMSFNTGYVNGDDINPELLRIKLSQDFSGQYTEEDVLAATWTDITERFTLPEAVTSSSSNYTESGVVDITPYMGDATKECVIGLFFRVTGIPADEKVSGHGRTQVFVSQFRVNSVAEDGTTTSLIDNANAKNATMVLGDEYANDQEKNYPQFKNNSTLGNYAWFSSMFQPAEHMYAYMITNPVAPLYTNLGPDKPIVVQSATDAPIEGYSYIFNEAGTYEVVFVAYGTSLTGEPTEIVKSFTITIE